MRHALHARFWYCLSSLALGVVLTQSAAAQTVWSGLTKTFSKASFADYTLPQNQDELTENVVLTRGDSGGLINYAAESIYFHGLSPVDTEWATDLTTDETIAASNWQVLASTDSFTSWIDAFGGPQSEGADIVGRNGVLHLISDDIYLDLRFTSWTPGGGGGYSYMRAEPSLLPEPDGDYNEDGVVGAADYVLWRKTLNQPAVPAGSGADGDESGTIDPGDYTYWVERFGNVPAGGGGSTSVPEASAAALALAGLLSLRIFSLFSRMRSASRQ